MTWRNAFSRRGILVAGGALAVAACAHVQWRGTPTPLRDAYKDAFLMGTAVNEAIVSGTDAASRDIVTQQFNTITAENVLKAGPLRPSPNVWNFGPADAFVAFGEQHKMFIIGHTLVWHNQTPPWFFADSAGKPKSHDAMVEQLRSAQHRVVLQRLQHMATRKTRWNRAHGAHAQA